jgi:hypothetical protein
MSDAIYKSINIKSVMIHYISVSLFLVAKAIGFVDSIVGYCLHSYFCENMSYDKNSMINTSIGLGIAMVFFILLFCFHKLKHIGLICGIVMVLATTVFIMEVLIKNYPFPIVAISLLVHSSISIEAYVDISDNIKAIYIIEGVSQCYILPRIMIYIVGHSYGMNIM